MSIRETAEKLNISTHTLKNWLKRENHGLEEFSFDREKHRLTKMANKKNSSEQILSKEMLSCKSNIDALSLLLENLNQLKLDTPHTLFIFSLLFLKKKGFLTERNQIVKKNNSLCFFENSFPRKHRVLEQAVEEYYQTLSPFPEENAWPAILNNSSILSDILLKEADLPGLVYQALRLEGNKIRQGAYYTPAKVIRQMLQSYKNLPSGGVFLDPCCGSGMFLCTFATLTNHPEDVYGMDSDPLAVYLARINLYIRFPSISGLSHIREADSLSSSSWNLREPSVIATNPPWGAHYSQSKKKDLRMQYEPIRSGESFSLFISKSIKEIPEGCKASFLLPESILYVKAHEDIRRKILNEAPPVKIVFHGPIFQGVYTSVIQMEIVKGGKQRKTEIRFNSNEGKTLIKEKQSLKRYDYNKFCCFNIHCSNRDREILDQIYRGQSSLPEKGSQWILGTVTGDNNYFLRETPEKGTIPILSGKELHPFYADPPRLYIRTDAGTWQQTRGAKDYGPDKIIYSFIGCKPSFVIDRKGLITLNSANCLIPPENQSLEALTAWYNSDLFRFLWQKQFHSLKLLKNHLESLPVPQWDDLQKQELLSLVKKGEKRQDIKPEINRIVYDFFQISPKDRTYVSTENRF
ncbi:MAG: hypothetical protein B6241_06090 [Spirochaetaceae bacterium 4572_59]|nr:MAG: hypothetical protein B6241_06090 [Spirochaetaceae bacterium 4572_59]